MSTTSDRGSYTYTDIYRTKFNHNQPTMLDSTYTGLNNSHAPGKAAETLVGNENSEYTDLKRGFRELETRPVNDNSQNNGVSFVSSDDSAKYLSVITDDKSGDYEILSNVDRTRDPNRHRPLPEVIDRNRLLPQMIECSEDQKYDYITSLSLHERESNSRSKKTCSKCCIVIIVVSLLGFILVCIFTGVGFALFKPAPKRNETDNLRTKIEPSTYLISVTTGSGGYDGTDANVFITLRDKYTSSNEHQIGNSAKGDFSHGRSTDFTIQSQPLGDILSVFIRHDNTTLQSGWLLIGLTVTDVRANRMYVFSFNKWLNTKYGISSKIPVSAAIDLVSRDILIQQHYGGSNFFNKPWDEMMYERGTSHSDYWLGIEVIHQLTKQGRFALRIDMRDINGIRYWEQYNVFIVESSNTNHTLQVEAFVGGNATTSRLGTMAVHNGLMFSTTDRDNDQSPEHCAEAFGGAWWYRQCYEGGAGLNMSPTKNFAFFSRGTSHVLLQWSRMSLIYK